MGGQHPLGEELGCWHNLRNLTREPGLAQPGQPALATKRITSVSQPRRGSARLFLTMSTLTAPLGDGTVPTPAPRALQTKRPSPELRGAEGPGEGRPGRGRGNSGIPSGRTCFGQATEKPSPTMGYQEVGCSVTNT